MKTSEILWKAANVIKRRGWCVMQLEDSDGRVCALGALNTVLSGDPNAFSEAAEPALDRACRRILRVLGRGVGSAMDVQDAVAEWNNRDCKSKKLIVEVFEKASLKE